MNTMIDDDDLTRLLGEAASSFPVPAEGPGFVLEELQDAAPKRPRLTRRLVKVSAVAAALVAGAIAVQAIGGDGLATKQTEVADGGSPATLGSAPEVNAPTTHGYSSDQSSGASTTTSLQPSGGQLPVSAVPQKAPAAAAAPDAFDDGARIVKTGTVGLVVGDGKVSGVVGRVRGIAVGVRGYVADEKSQELGDDPSSTLTLRVPVGAFERTVQAVRDQVKGGVGKVESATTSGQDVTAQYADLQAQIQSLTAARNRFLTILSRANTIGETLSVQQRVDSTQLQIDRLEGQRRALAKQSELATLTVTVGEKPKDVAKAEVQSGLGRAWDDAKEGFSSGVEGLVSRSGRALLVLIVAGVSLVLLRFGWRLARRRLV